MDVTDEQIAAAARGEMVDLGDGLVLTTRRAIEAEREAGRRFGELQTEVADGRPVRAVPAGLAVARLREALAAGRPFPDVSDLVHEVQ
ncbi:MAG: hypothetical protein S0880_07400 [Actinomycetota bacterium]|nr:hypothetical protein [Actinomycetota bacterium]